MKIYEIACMVGYPEQKYFSKVLKDCVGVPAKRYALIKKRNSAAGKFFPAALFLPSLDLVFYA